MKRPRKERRAKRTEKMTGGQSCEPKMTQNKQRERRNRRIRTKAQNKLQKEKKKKCKEKKTWKQIKSNQKKREEKKTNTTTHDFREERSWAGRRDLSQIAQRKEQESKRTAMQMQARQTGQGTDRARSKETDLAGEAAATSDEGGAAPKRGQVRPLCT